MVTVNETAHFFPEKFIIFSPFLLQLWHNYETTSSPLEKTWKLFKIILYISLYVIS